METERKQRERVRCIRWKQCLFMSFLCRILFAISNFLFGHHVSSFIQSSSVYLHGTFIHIRLVLGTCLVYILCNVMLQTFTTWYSSFAQRRANTGHPEFLTISRGRCGAIWPCPLAKPMKYVTLCQTS